MNRKRVLLVIISSSLLLWMFSLLFSAFVNATPEDIVVKGNHLTKQDFGSVTSSLNPQYSFLRGDDEIDFYESDNEILGLNTINWLAEGSLADLNITNVYLDPLEPMRGDDVIFYAEVENQGTENATDFVVELYLNAELIANATFSLDAGVKDTYWNTDPWTATSGSHTVKWIVDATNEIAETNEDNNEMSKTFMVEAEGIELYYDDGTADYAWCWTLPGGMFAVRFTPLTSGRLIECSFYITSDPATFNVHVLDTDKNDMISPFPETPTSTGWFSVNLSAYEIIVSPDVDFYVAMESTVAYAPYLGDDWSGPDGRSWDFNRVNWSPYVDGDYMIRTVIKTVADLNITTVRLEPYPVKPGDYVTFYADVENQGSEDATDFIVDLYLDEENIASGTFSLAAGANTTYYYESWEATLGNHTIRWVIDATNVIDELSEDNNEMSKSFIVGYVLTVHTPYSHITVKIDEFLNLTDADGNFQTIVDEGDHEVEVETPVFLDPGSRGVFVQWDDENSANPRTIFVNNNLSLTAEYKTQYHLTVSSTHGTTGGEGWYDEGDTAYATVTLLTVPGPTGVQYVFTHWSEDASGDGSPSDPIIMDGPKTAVANWKTQYLVTFVQTGSDATATGIVVTVNGDTKTFSDLPYTTWVDDGDSISYSYSDPVSSSVEDKRFRLADVTGPTSPITITEPMTITGNYMTQYYLTVVSPYGTPGGAGWYDNCTTAYATLDTDAVDHLNGTRRLFMQWSGDTSGTDYTTSDPIHMDAPKSAIASWKTQHLVTFAQTGLDSTATGTVLTVNGDTKTFSDLPYTTWVDDGDSISYSYSDPVSSSSSSTSDRRFSLVDVTGPDSPISVTGPATVTAEYKMQYYLTMSTNFGTVTPGSGWHDAGSTVQIEASALGVADGERYVWLGWTGTGDSSYSGNDNPASITMNRPTAETAAWRHEYYLTVTSSYGSPTPESGWFEAGKSITALVTSPVAGPVVSQYLCTGWTGTGCVSTSGTTTSVTFTIDEPSSITWNWETQQPLSIEVLALFIGVFSVICTVTAFAVNRRKRGRVKTLLDDIDNVFFSHKKNARRCEAELYRLKDIVLEDYKNGKINEQSYDVLNERIDDYLSKL